MWSRTKSVFKMHAEHKNVLVFFGDFPPEDLNKTEVAEYFVSKVMKLKVLPKTLS